MNKIGGLVSLCVLSISACLSLPAMSQDGSTLAGSKQAGSNQADSTQANPSGIFGGEWVPVDPARLADMRGGLVMPSGLSLSFGIERLVYVNGQLIASATLQIPDLGRITAEQASALAAINEGRVVQIGEGNRVDSGAGGNALVIQNTLDGQNISALTTLNVGVGTLGMLQELNSYDALRSALITSPGTP